MTDVDSEWPPDHFAGVRRVRDGADNSSARAIPQQDRLLTIVCRAVAGRRLPYLLGVVYLGDTGEVATFTYPLVCPRSVPPRVVKALCGCGRLHPVDLARVWVALDRLRDRPRKARTVETWSVAPLE